jgi:hypothetical protein
MDVIYVVFEVTMSQMWRRVPVEVLATFRRNILPQSTGLKSKPNKYPAGNRWQAKFGLLFNSDDGGNTFLRNVSDLPDYTASHPRTSFIINVSSSQVLRSWNECELISLHLSRPVLNVRKLLSHEALTDCEITELNYNELLSLWRRIENSEPTQLFGETKRDFQEGVYLVLRDARSQTRKLRCFNNNLALKRGQDLWALDIGNMAAGDILQA